MKKLFTKKFVRIIASALIVATIAISCSAIMISSKVSYNKYYDAAIKEKEYQKYLNSLPLELKDISLSLVEGKRYFTDGVAEPKKDDLNVVAHFTEKGQDFDKILTGTEYDMVVADNFAEQGGKIGVSYTYTPEKKGDEEVTPIIKTAEIEVALTKVALESITVVQKPYRIVYSDEMKFDVDGMSVLAKFNNGHEAIISSDKLVSENGGNLKAGDEKATVSYTVDGVKQTADVPVTVMKAAAYTDGEIISIATEGDLVVENGSVLSEANIPVRATYENGNRILLEKSDYTIKGNTEKASISKNCLITCTLKADDSVVCKSLATVRFDFKAKNANIVNATAKTVNDKEAVTDFESGATLTFNINASSITKGKFTVSLSNAASDSVNIGQSLSLTVNGEYYPVSRLLKTVENDTAYVEYALPSAVLYSGDNTVKVSVVGGAKIAIESFAYETRYDGELCSSMGEYIEKNQDLSKLAVSSVTGWDSNYGKPYMHGLCTDGTYVYGICLAYGTNNPLVRKMNPATGETIAVSKEAPAGTNENFGAISYVDGKIIMMTPDGKKYYTDSATLKDDWKEYAGFDMGDYTGKVFKDALYSTEREAFVFRTNDRTIEIVSKSGEKISSFNLEEGDGAPKRITVSNGYIFALYTANGKQPIFAKYGFDGKKVKKYSLTFDSASVLGSSVNISNTNVQGMVVAGNSIYFSVLHFPSGAHQSKIIKGECTGVPEDLDVELTLGEYVAACGKNSVTPKAVGARATQAMDTLKPVYGLAMDGVSDGEYIYLCVNHNGNWSNSMIYKIDPSTHKVLAKTSPFVTGSNTSGSNGRLYYKDGVVYLIPSYQYPNKVFGIATKDFVGMYDEVKEFALPIQGTGSVADIVYSSAVGKYATLIGNRVRICSETGAKELESETLAYSGMNPSSLTSDDKYLYVSYVANGQTVVPVDVFTWDGVKVGTIEITGVNLSGTTDYNVQSVFMHDNELYAVVCTWILNKMYCHLFKVTADTSVIG